MPTSGEWTSIPVRAETRDLLRVRKKEAASWSEFLEQLARDQRTADGRIIYDK